MTLLERGGPSEAFGADGVLESVSVRRVDVEVLRAHLGQTITDIGDLDV